jgi:hypothetical protein
MAPLPGHELSGSLTSLACAPPAICGIIETPCWTSVSLFAVEAAGLESSRVFLDPKLSGLWIVEDAGCHLVEGNSHSNVPHQGGWLVGPGTGFRLQTRQNTRQLGSWTEVSELGIPTLHFPALALLTSFNPLSIMGL